MMKVYFFCFSCFFYSCLVYAEDTTWKNECIGYYQLQLPDDIEVGIYPAERIYTEDFGGIDSIFGEYHQLRSQGKNVTSPYSHFYYENYLVMVSEGNFGDLSKYKEQVAKKLSYDGDIYSIKNNSPSVFFLSYEHSHSLYIKDSNRLYQFMKGGGVNFLLWEQIKRILTLTMSLMYSHCWNVFGPENFMKSLQKKDFACHMVLLLMIQARRIAI